MEVLHNTIMREERGYMYPGYATYALATFAAENVCAGKHLDIYIYFYPRNSVLSMLTILIYIS